MRSSPNERAEAGERVEMRESISAIILFLIIIAAISWWNVYSFADCKKVGHSTMYCIGRIGK